MTDSAFRRHIPCDACGSSDGASLYTDGHTHCFVCDRTVQPPKPWRLPVKDVTSNDDKPEVKAIGDLVGADAITISELHDRKLWNATCALWGYGEAYHRGDRVQVATYYAVDGTPVAQKLRGKDKRFAVLGDMKSALPFGAHLWAKSGRKIVVTEGEIDAMSMSQVQDNKYPVVSISGGAGGQVKREIARHREYLSNFEEVILMFDMDDVGQKAAKEAALALSFPTGKVKLASLPLKDANEMLVAGRWEELRDAVWRAVPFRPGGFVTLEDISKEILKPRAAGIPWPWPTLTEATHGRRPGEIVTVGAGTGIGKTSLCFQVAADDVRRGGKVGLVMLETPPSESGLRLASAYAGKAFFTPGLVRGDEREIVQTLLEMDGRVFIYSATGSTEWAPVESVIRYWANAEGVEHVVIDNLTAFAANAEDERRTLDSVMASIAGITAELSLYTMLVTHLTRPEGTPHEEGGRVMQRHCRGSNAIGMWSHFLFGLEGNTQAEDQTERHRRTLRGLKDRFTGRSNGVTVQLEYDPLTARLEERGRSVFHELPPKIEQLRMAA